MTMKESMAEDVVDNDDMEDSRIVLGTALDILNNLVHQACLYLPFVHGFVRYSTDHSRIANKHRKHGTKFRQRHK